MIELSNLLAQTIQPGQAITFDNVIHHKGCGECFNKQTPTSVKLRARGGTYKVEFSGNVSAATAGDALQLAIAIGGSPLVETTMNSTPATAGVLNNIGTGTYVVVGCCDLDRITVTNTGTVPVNLAANANLRIRRVG